MRLISPITEDVELSERYDSEDDVYYVTVKTGEPSVCFEIDDRLLVEVGLFTELPTGFRILNYSKHKTAVKGFKEQFKAKCKKAGHQKIKNFDSRQRAFDKFFDKALT